MDADESLRVLVVDDDKMNRRFLAWQLEKFGCAVDAVANGAEALACASVREYAMVFTDVRMADMDGYRLTAELRARERATRVPIIAVSAGSHAELRTAALEHGLDDVLGKPVAKRALALMLACWSAGRELDWPAGRPGGETESGVSRAASVAQPSAVDDRSVARMRALEKWSGQSDLIAESLVAAAARTRAFLDSGASSAQFVVAAHLRTLGAIGFADILAALRRADAVARTALAERAHAAWSLVLATLQERYDVTI